MTISLPRVCSLFVFVLFIGDQRNFYGFNFHVVLQHPSHYINWFAVGPHCLTMSTSEAGAFTLAVNMLDSGVINNVWYACVRMVHHL